VNTPELLTFKLNQVVPGLTGLIIAALFATMSSVDSGINSFSAALTTDWYRRQFARDREEQHYLRIARVTTLVLGVLATIAALFLGQIGELWQIAVALMGFWTGPLWAIFLLGHFTRRANTPGSHRRSGGRIVVHHLVPACRWQRVSTRLGGAGSHARRWLHRQLRWAAPDG